MESLNDSCLISVFDTFVDLSSSGEVDEEKLLSFNQALIAMDAHALVPPWSPHQETLRVIRDKVDKAVVAMKRKRVHKLVPIPVSSSFMEHLVLTISQYVGDRIPFDDIAGLPPRSYRQEELDFPFLCEYLKQVIIPTRKLRDENALERYLFEVMIPVFGSSHIHRQYNIGGFLGLKSDLDFFNGQMGVELKVGNLSAAVMQRLVGQTVYYGRRVYGPKLIVLVAGKGNISATLAELGEFVEELGATFIYRKAVAL